MTRFITIAATAALFATSTTTTLFADSHVEQAEVCNIICQADEQLRENSDKARLVAAIQTLVHPISVSSVAEVAQLRSAFDQLSASSELRAILRSAANDAPNGIRFSGFCLSHGETVRISSNGQIRICPDWSTQELLAVFGEDNG